MDFFHSSDSGRYMAKAGIAQRSRQYFAGICAVAGSILFNIKELTAPSAGQCVSLSQLSTWTSTPIDTLKDSRIVPLGREVPFPSHGHPVKLIAPALKTTYILYASSFFLRIRSIFIRVFPFVTKMERNKMNAAIN